MIDATVIKATERYKSFLHPIIGMNKLSIANLENISNFQIGALRNYTGIMIKHLKATTEVNDSVGLKNLIASQLETMVSLRERIIEDTKAFGELMRGFNTGFDKLLHESMAMAQEYGHVEQAGKSAVK